jgi:type VI secretion system protein ImpJ
MHSIRGKKPVWAEGVLLGQQHFQAFDAYQEHVHAQRQFMLSSFSYGFKHINLDQSALARGTVSVLSLDYILRSGRFIEYRSCPGNELTLAVAADQPGLTISVGIALNDGASSISGYNNSDQLCAYKADYLELSDQHDSSRVREVMVATPHLVLFKDEEAPSSFEILPLIKLVRDFDGNLTLDHQFIPPLLDISASAYLKDLLNRTNNLVNAKTRLLLNRRQGSGSVTDFGPNEMNSFLLLGGLLPSAKMLEHLTQVGHIHPERLYCELTLLLSRIAIFEHSQLIDSLPVYKHDELPQVFAQFDSMIDQLLEDVVPKKMQALKLERLSNAIYQVSNIDLERLSLSEFYLAVYLDSLDSKWIDTFGQQVKVAATQNLETIVASALNGLKLSHCQRLPNKLAVKSGFEYFKMDQVGDIWQEVINQQSIGVFIPLIFQQASVDIVMVDKTS